jgi:hypothetical protein
VLFDAAFVYLAENAGESEQKEREEDGSKKSSADRRWTGEGGRKPPPRLGIM